METINKLNEHLEALEKEIQGGSVPLKATKTKKWGGADVIITGKATPEERRWLGTSRGNYLVVTPFYRELSWLFEQLRDLNLPQVDYLSKYSFYEDLAKAAMAYNQENPENDNPTGLLLCVLKVVKETWL